jgi:hypothetical protein
MKCALREPNGKDIKAVAAAMRQCDRDEIWASSHSLPRRALERGVATAVFARTGLVNDKPVCIFGVSPGSLLSGGGVPWMLATPGLLRAQRPFLRLSRPLVELMNDIFPQLVNYVDARNVDSVRWLRSLGFTVEPAAPHGVERLPFHRFSRTRHV